jgi:hypothetical protein
MVSPPDKGGGQVIPFTQLIRAAQDCATDCAATFPSLTAFGDARGTSITTEYMAVRDPGAGANGWATHSITPKQNLLTLVAVIRKGQSAYQEELSPDLSRGVYRSTTALTADPYVSRAVNLYARTDLRSPGAGTYELQSSCPFCEATTLTPLPAWDGFAANVPASAGHSADFEHVLFESRQSLTGEIAGRIRVYESDGGQVRLVGLIPAGTATSCGGEGGPACVLPSAGSGSSKGASMAGLGATGTRILPRTISSDGSRANFTAPISNASSGTLVLEGAPENRSKLYQRDSHGTASTADDTTVKLNASERTPPAPEDVAFYNTASADGHRVFFRAPEALTNDAPAVSFNLYMWHDDYLNDEVQKLAVEASAGQFRLLLGAEETADLPFDATPSQIETAIEALPAVDAANGEVTVAGGPGDEIGSIPYTIRFEGGVAETDEPTMTTAAGTTPLSGGAATATVSPWVKGGGHLTVINRDEEPGDPAATAEGFIGASEDGSYAYYIAGSQLVAGEPLLSAQQRGIYLWHEGQISYIGYFTRGVGDVWLENLPAGNVVGTTWNLGTIPARVGPDGKTLLIRSDEGAGLGGYDHNTTGCGPGGNRPCSEYYVYHAETGQLQCASCNPSGAKATADATAFTEVDRGAASGSAHENHTLSDNGRYVFFSSGERLVPEDRNGKVDAYEYDTQAEEVHLLSSGRSEGNSYFMDASADGHDVFIATKEPLSAWDVDDAYDLYDARVGGGIAEPQPAPPSCQGDACQPAALSLDDQTPASASYAGPGNEKGRARPRCPKGKHRAKAGAGKHRCAKHKHHKRDANSNRRTSR